MMAVCCDEGDSPIAWDCGHLKAVPNIRIKWSETIKCQTFDPPKIGEIPLKCVNVRNNLTCGHRHFRSLVHAHKKPLNGLIGQVLHPISFPTAEGACYSDYDRGPPLHPKKKNGEFSFWWRRDGTMPKDDEPRDEVISASKFTRKRSTSGASYFSRKKHILDYNHKQITQARKPLLPSHGLCLDATFVTPESISSRETPQEDKWFPCHILKTGEAMARTELDTRNRKAALLNVIDTSTEGHDHGHKSAGQPGKSLARTDITKQMNHETCIESRDIPAGSGALARIEVFDQDRTGRWTKNEHEAFLKGLRMFGEGKWKKIAAVVKTRSVIQTRTHAQKYFLKLKKKRKIEYESESSLEEAKLVKVTNRPTLPDKAGNHITAKEKDVEEDDTELISNQFIQRSPSINLGMHTRDDVVNMHRPMERRKSYDSSGTTASSDTKEESFLYHVEYGGSDFDMVQKSTTQLLCVPKDDIIAPVNDKTRQHEHQPTEKKNKPILKAPDLKLIAEKVKLSSGVQKVKSQKHGEQFQKKDLENVGREKTGRWTLEEHEKFLEAIVMYGNDWNRWGRKWERIAAQVKTRTALQTRTHAQKYFEKLRKEQIKDDCKKVTVKQYEKGLSQTKIYQAKVRTI